MHKAFRKKYCPYFFLVSEFILKSFKFLPTLFTRFSVIPVCKYLHIKLRTTYCRLKIDNCKVSGFLSNNHQAKTLKQFIEVIFAYNADNMWLGMEFCQNIFLDWRVLPIINLCYMILEAIPGILFYKLIPPSMINSAPVINEESSLLKWATILLTSPALPHLCKGTLSMIQALTPCNSSSL